MGVAGVESSETIRYGYAAGILFRAASELGVGRVAGGSDERWRVIATPCVQVVMDFYCTVPSSNLFDRESSPLVLMFVAASSAASRGDVGKSDSAVKSQSDSAVAAAVVPKRMIPLPTLIYVAL